MVVGSENHLHVLLEDKYIDTHIEKTKRTNSNWFLKSSICISSRKICQYIHVQTETAIGSEYHVRVLLEEKYCVYCAQEQTKATNNEWFRKSFTCIA